MKVFFLELVPNVWHKWEIKEVSDSYARNFLIPKNLAKRLTPDEENKLIQAQKKQEAHKRELIENRHNIVDKLNWQKITFKAHIWNNWKMFWSFWEKDLIEKIYKDFWIKLEKKNIDMMDWHIKNIWTKDIYIKLSSDSMAKITVIVE